MAQRISKEEFEKQSAEFTKKSLAELNEQLKNFHPKKVFHDEEKDAEEDFFDSDEIFKNIIISLFIFYISFLRKQFVLHRTYM